MLAILPTGGGKSVCFQIPGLLQEGISLVVTPLVALMKDQVENLQKKGIKAAAVYSGMQTREVDITLDNCIYGDIRFLYFSPERIENALFQERVKQMNVVQVVIDEAHCVSQWGHDFRPSYFSIPQLREIHPDVRFIALTATATPRVRQEIVEKLQLTSDQQVVGSFARQNLSYSVRHVEDKSGKLIEILTKIEGAAIVYVQTRKETKEIATFLDSMNISALPYHAGLAHDTRSAVQEKWMHGAIRVVVATNAFGMGIDKPDVRIVIHLGLNRNMESYYQEAGRAGRDGKKAYATTVFQDEDVEALRTNFKRSYPDIAFLQHVYQCLANYYKLAVGSVHPTGFDFPLHKFSDQYNMDHLEVFHALKKLEEFDIVKFTEVIYGTSAVFIHLDHQELYKFQVANKHLDALIKSLLRMNGGELFTQFTKISEYKLSRTLKVSEELVHKQLRTLQKMGVITYSEKKDYPQLIFLTPRLDAKNLPIGQKLYNERKKLELAKMELMIAYSSTLSNCRTQIIQDYFGEDLGDPCSICDNCLARTGNDGDIHQMELRALIIQLVPQDVRTTKALSEKLTPFEPEEIVEEVRKMLDAGVLRVVDDQLYLED